MEFLERRFQRHFFFNNDFHKPAWVNERSVANNRHQSEPRHRNDRLQYLAPAGGKSNGVVVSEDGPRLLYHSEDNGGMRYNETITRRQKSLPSRKPTTCDRSFDVRKTNSASDKEKVQNHRNAKQTVSIYLASPGAKDLELGPETKQVIHGIRTRSHEENYLRSTKFASSWAKVRAENLALRDGSPSEISPPRTSRDGSNESPRRDGSPAKSTDYSGGSGGYFHHHKFVLTKPRGRPPNRTHQKNKNKKVSKLNTFREINKTESPERSSSPRSGKSQNTPDYNKDGESQYTMSFESERGYTENGNMSEEEKEEEEKLKKRKPAWNSSVNVASQPQPRINLRKYEKDLTFKPTITTKEEVYMAYTGHETLLPAEAESDDEKLSSLSGEEDSASPRSNSQSPARSKERMLNKREARAYLKMTAVYGSDAFKNQRKQWFLQKLSLAQDQKAKLEDERRKAEEKKREEDRKKQKRQLNYVREKFRKEQVHRFRTQYVTSRVLEHEQANRHEYGLPEDFDDMSKTNETANNSPSKGNVTRPGDTAKEAETSLLPQDHINSQNSVYKNKKMKNSDLSPNGNNNKKYIRNTTNKQTDADRRNEQIQKEKEEERQKQRQEQQKSWYAAYERKPRSETTKPPLINRDLKTKKKTENQKNGNETKPLNSNAAKPQPAFGNGHEKSQKSSETERQDGPPAMNSQDKRMKESSKVNGLRKRSNDLQQDNSSESVDEWRKENNRDLHKTGIDSKDTNNRRGLISREKEKDTESFVKHGSVHNNKSSFSKNKYTGPSLPHTKSHTDPENTKDKKGNAPYIFTGHFRQEADGTYHKLDKSNPPGNVNLRKDDKETNESEKSGNNAKNPDNNDAQPLQLSSAAKVSEKIKASKPEQKQNNTDSHGRGKVFTKISESVNQGEVKGRRDSTKSKPNLNAKHSSNNTSKTEQNKLQMSPTTSNDQSKVNNSIARSLRDAKTMSDRAHPSGHQSSGEKEAKTMNKDQSPSNIVQASPAASGKLKQQQQHKQSNSGAVNQGQGTSKRQTTASSGRSTDYGRKKLQGPKALASLMFDVNMGPSWDPHQKVPKMEGIDTVVIKTKDGKGQVVKQRKQVKNVVKDAENLLKLPVEAPEKRPMSKRSYKLASPDVTLGSDFDVDDDEEETVGDIFERLRKKYNIKIDSDEEDV
ncbi:hypothetical protein PoB_005236700 [Plakobranchus ocellatus]|uniref:Uncharacterized protein n=1 Tax=Plakobranchus ocellatus TaxID=259542 RepID=A0AAV4C3P0_9GAST|nr:hypothetical protein PoB_005236700 [Plakobranchus ocellatus]